MGKLPRFIRRLICHWILDCKTYDRGRSRFPNEECNDRGDYHFWSCICGCTSVNLPFKPPTPANGKEATDLSSEHETSRKLANNKQKEQ